MERFRTLVTRGQAEWEIKKSRFIGHAYPALNEAEASQVIDRIREEHASATHNVFAYRIGPQPEMERFSDDGEPGGTAGAPVLEVIRRERLWNVVVVVTRYFGGIKLGAGGLVRAYSKSAMLAIQAVQTAWMAPFQRLTIMFDYPALGRLENEMRAMGCLIEKTDYQASVAMQVLVPKEKLMAWRELVADITAGQAQVSCQDITYHVANGQN